MRPLLRLGWREARRHRLRSALVAALIGLPVAAGVVAVVIGPTILGTDGTVSGGAPIGDDAVELLPSPTALVGAPTGVQPGDPDVADALRAIERVAPDADAVVERSVAAWRATGTDATVVPVLVRDLEPGRSAPALPMPLTAGRPPAGPDEVVISAALADAAQLGLGDRLELALPDVALDVVGVVDQDGCDDCEAAVVTSQAYDAHLSRGWSRDGRSARVVVHAPEGMDASALFTTMDRPDLGLYPTPPDASTSSASERAWTRLWTVVAAAFLLVWTGLIAACGLAVGARRRQRELGLLAANGADPGQLRLAVVAEGSSLGVVGSVLGAVVGVVVSWALVRWWDGLAAPTDPALTALWVAALIVCGVAAATAAARAAATGLDRSTPNDLLRGRRRAPRPAPHWFAAGAVAIAIGLGLAEVVTGSIGERDLDDRLVGVLVTSSLGAITVGLVATVVGVSRLLPRLTAALPLPVRLAGRDLHRHGLRVGASCGAVALTLAASIALATLYESSSTSDPGDPTAEFRVLELPDGGRYLSVATEGYELVGDDVVERTPPAGVAADLRAAGWPAGEARAFPAPAGLRACHGPAAVDSTCEGTWLTVLDDQLVDRLRPELRDALVSALPVTAGADRTTLVGADGAAVESVDVSGSPNGASPYGGRLFDPNTVLVTTRGATALGVDLATRPWNTQVFIVGDHGDEATVDRLDDDLGGRGLRAVQPWPDEALDPRWIVAGVVAFVTAVTLLVVLFALALMRVESRPDDAVMAVVGASPSVSRRSQAARAAVMVLIAAVPAALVGWGLVRVLSSTPVGVPWWAMGVALIVLPLLAGALAGLSDRPGRRLRHA